MLSRAKKYEARQGRKAIGTKLYARKGRKVRRPKGILQNTCIESV